MMDIHLPYEFGPALLLRSPVYSWEDYSLESVPELLKDANFSYAIYLANPTFFNSLKKKNFTWSALSDKEQLTLKKYFNRMSFRATPFGAFSTFTSLNWDKSSHLVLVEQDLIEQFINIDQAILAKIAEKVGRELPPDQFYRLNHTLYQLGKDYRYILSNYDTSENIPVFTLESIAVNKLTTGLFRCFRKNKMSGDDIKALVLTLTLCQEDQAEEYFEFLKNAQIIVPDRSLNLLGTDFLKSLKLYPSAISPSVRHFLTQLNKSMAHITYGDIAQLEQLASQISEHIPGLKSSREASYYYANSARRATKGGIDQRYQQNLLESIACLAQLSSPSEIPSMRDFIKEFIKRYDRQRVPLLIALDPETGIGYGNLTDHSQDQELLKEVKFPNKAQGKTMMEWTAVHQLLLKTWLNRKEGDLYSPVRIDPRDLPVSPDAGNDPVMPPSLPVIFRIFNDEVYIENIGGVSATSLLGRFTVLDESVRSMAGSIARAEEAANPDVIFADISILSDTHVDNINRRAHVYSYEIPINTSSELAPDKQIPLNDLWLSVSNGQLILESKTLKKVVVPRLTSAYNYHNNQLSSFVFLCDLQYQGFKTNLGFDAETYLPGLDFYPRIYYKNNILALAKWIISGNDLQLLQRKSEEESLDYLRELRLHLKLPGLLALTRHDQQLVFNFDRASDQVFFLQCIKGAKRILIREFMNTVTPTIETSGKLLTGQFIGILTQNKRVCNVPLPKKALPVKIEREFALGGRWLYLKIYCSPDNVNSLLVNKIYPAVTGRLRNVVSTWFFVRYTDSAHHIRLRIQVVHEELGPVLKRLKSVLSGDLRYQVIKEYYADTYRRELERYGADLIEEVEQFFHSSTMLILAFLKANKSARQKSADYGFGFLSVDLIIKAAFDDEQMRLTFIKHVVESFFAEFGKDQVLKIDLDLKFRKLRPEINALMTDQTYFKGRRLQKLAKGLTTKASGLFIGTRGIKIDRRMQLAADLIHMHLNRLFSERQREQEFIIYYCLLKYKTSCFARSR